MTRHRRLIVPLILLVITSMACATLVPDKAGEVDVPVTDVADVLPTLTATAESGGVTEAAPGPTATPIEATLAWPDPVFDEKGVRVCDFIPGVSEPLNLSPEEAHLPTPTPEPLPTIEPDPQADPEAVAEHLEIFGEVREIIEDQYVDPVYVAQEFGALADRYEALIESGLSDEGFYDAMKAMIYELGDEHSYFMDPEEVIEDDEIYAGLFDYVGLGAIGLLGENGEDSIMAAIFPGSTADEANLRPHDAVLAVDGLSPYDEDGIPRTLGEEGTEMTLTVRRPGEPPRNLTVTRRRVNSTLPVDYCMFTGTRIGYIVLPWFESENIDDEAIAAMEHMTADGPLDGLILDNRINSGGFDRVMQPILGMFIGGTQGRYVSRDSSYELEIDPVDIGGSQSVPLVVLIGRDTVSNGEISSGLLGLTGRATLIGETTLGNVEHLYQWDFADGSRAILAIEAYEPPGLTTGIWEETGIEPDIEVLSGWEHFTEANDPGIAAALDFLMTP